MFKVGQILFTVLKDSSNKIVPIKIVEKTITTDLEKETIDYKVILPFNDSKKILLNKFDIYFNSIDEVETYLLNNAKKSIVKYLQEAKELNLFFEPKVQDDIETEIDKCKKDDEYVIVDMGDGKKAKIKPDFSLQKDISEVK